jgi:hypothetical protein
MFRRDKISYREMRLALHQLRFDKYRAVLIKPMFAGVLELYNNITTNNLENLFGNERKLLEAVRE